MADDARSPGRINLSALEAADIDFTDLAADAPTSELQAALTQAARIAAAMWRTQAGMLAVVRNGARWPHGRPGRGFAALRPAAGSLRRLMTAAPRPICARADTVAGDLIVIPGRGAAALFVFMEKHPLFRV